MTRSEVIEQIAVQRRKEQCFIKTWETGHTFVDIDLIDRFIAKGEKEGVIEGFELLDLEQTWQTLIDLDPDKLIRVKSGDGEVIEWQWSDSHGIEQKTVYPFTPEGIMTIIDDEFFA
ncbi:MAG TPA: hypothetical protein VFF53_07570 [Geobacteraceae bacterium]|nr:hypothetical protein [Geobacteraceae bacterium]